MENRYKSGNDIKFFFYYQILKIIIYYLLFFFYYQILKKVFLLFFTNYINRLISTKKNFFEKYIYKKYIYIYINIIIMFLH